EAFNRKLRQIPDQKMYRAWASLIDACENFLGNYRSSDYKEIFNLLKAFNDVGINMTSKIHMLEYHLNEFPEQVGAVSDQHGERHHQVMAPMEKINKGTKTVNALARQLFSQEAN